MLVFLKKGNLRMQMKGLFFIIDSSIIHTTVTTFNNHLSAKAGEFFWCQELLMNIW